ncbi:phosphoribosylanthranilate isomerase [Ichthyenterobacterium sp. W332]|uniref:N-(5'-phosphoribosyl)anthranilate isomerase n=1 Tax=Microcosmobacter mediterraneus TaxID=3075607 RepID=A0ABU2YJB5_9FLAO|nr:phosphoribosylanthranilate isomerase [Ichthyenterobacterium sp. W332]MDT0558262.1 phosphoribosylanthranilate isomerase [Ichthyenterobacterium sp. W332]
MKLKVCGMKHNIAEVAELKPDYLGFIFHEPSSRHFDEAIPSLPGNIQKVGVFVDESIEYVVGQIENYSLNAVQLHGHETPEYCRLVKTTGITVIKVFSIKNEFDFSILTNYEEVCDYFLFDTNGKLPGGNGYTFDWKILQNYPSTKPFFLSGGIGLEELEQLKKFKETTAATYCYAIDVNSRFEIEPGLKNIEDLKKIKTSLSFRT